MRLDQYLVEHHFFESRNKAASAVKEGHFTVDGKKTTKPAFDVSEKAVVVAIQNKKVYVARSAWKLIRAYEIFQLKWQDKTVADLGASTGGFCQVLLENDVKKIYAVDIGTAQLHPSIRADKRVVNMEHTNARYLSAESFSEPINVVTADLSFISIKAVLPAIYQTLTSMGQAVVLIKPQFEAGPQNLSKSGVVTNKKVQYKVVEDVALFAQSCGFGIKGLTFSGLAGESGNREYLLLLEKGSDTTISIPSAAYAAVFTEESNE